MTTVGCPFFLKRLMHENSDISGHTEKKSAKSVKKTFKLYGEQMRSVSSVKTDREVYSLICSFSIRGGHGCHLTIKQMAGRLGKRSVWAVRESVRRLMKDGRIERVRNGVYRPVDIPVLKSYFIVYDWGYDLFNDWTSMLLFFLIFSYTRQGKACFMTEARMGQYVGVSLSTVQRHLRRLIDGGWLFRFSDAEGIRYRADMDKVNKVFAIKEEAKIRQETAPVLGREEPAKAIRPEDYQYDPPAPGNCGQTRLPDRRNNTIEKMRGEIYNSEKVVAAQLTNGAGFTFDEEVRSSIKAMADIIFYKRGHMGMALCGAPGNGKTTAAKAFVLLCRRLKEKAQEHFVEAFFTASQIVDAYAKEDSGKLEAMTSADVLVIDDAGIEPATIKSYGTPCYPVRDIIKQRYDLKKFTVITTNLPYMQLFSRYGEAVKDRLLGSFAAIPFVGGSFRTKPQKYDYIAGISGHDSVNVIPDPEPESSRQAALLDDMVSRINASLSINKHGFKS